MKQAILLSAILVFVITRYITQGIMQEILHNLIILKLFVYYKFINVKNFFSIKVINQDRLHI